MKRIIALVLLVLTLAFALAGCGGKASYKDGTYTAQSSVFVAEDNSDEESGNGYGVVTITIKDNVITDCKFEMYMEDGTLKAEDYGKKNGEIANEGFYKMAQNAVAAGQSYAEMLKESGSLKGVDAISGATISFGQFTEAVEEALAQAKE